MCCVDDAMRRACVQRCDDDDDDDDDDNVSDESGATSVLLRMMIAEGEVGGDAAYTHDVDGERVNERCEGDDTPSLTLRTVGGCACATCVRRRSV